MNSNLSFRGFHIIFLLYLFPGEGSCRGHEERPQMPIIRCSTMKEKSKRIEEIEKRKTEKLFEKKIEIEDAEI